MVLMGWLFRSDGYSIRRRMRFSTLVPIFVKTGRWSAKLCAENCIKISYFHRQILLLHVKDPTFIYPTINSVAIRIQKEIVKKSQ